VARAGSDRRGRVRTGTAGCAPAQPVVPRRGSLTRAGQPKAAAGVLLLLLATTLGNSIAAQAPAPANSSAALPGGAGAEVLRARCMSCHDSDLIVSQKLSEAGWGREIDKMVRWGATVSETERPALLAYLSTHFAPLPAASHGRAAEGESVFKRACLVCHGADLTEQQRLSPAGWTREVEKMMRWGAVVGDAEKPALVDFLSSRFPVR
jgi:mono/diheme cytochrome c family protein